MPRPIGPPGEIDPPPAPFGEFAALAAAAAAAASYAIFAVPVLPGVLAPKMDVMS
jgi:hypothetical protein